MSNDVIRALLAIVVMAHGVGYVLFMPVIYSTMKPPDSRNSCF